MTSDHILRRNKGFNGDGRNSKSQLRAMVVKEEEEEDCCEIDVTLAPVLLKNLRAPIESSNFELYLIRRESNRIKLRPINSIRIKSNS